MLGKHILTREREYKLDDTNMHYKMQNTGTMLEEEVDNNPTAMRPKAMLDEFCSAHQCEHHMSGLVTLGVLFKKIQVDNKKEKLKGKREVVYLVVLVV